MKWKDFKINFKRQQHFHDPELALGFAPHHASEGRPEGARCRQPALRALVGDAARPAHHQGFRGERQEGGADSARSSRSISCPSSTRRRRCDDCTDESGNDRAWCSRPSPERAAVLSPARLRTGNAPGAVNPQSMSWIRAAASLMGSNNFYREERPVSPGRRRRLLDGHPSRHQCRIPQVRRGDRDTSPIPSARRIRRCIRTRIPRCWCRARWCS